MYSEGDQGIVDQSAVAMRVATIAAGIWLSYVVCGASAVYVALTWDRPHRAVIAALFGAGILSAAVISRLPHERIVRSRLREAFFLGWSLADLGLMIMATLADGGTASPITLFLFIPVVFSALSYPLASVLTVGGLSVAAFLAVAVSVGGAGWGYEGLFTVMLLCTGALSAWHARNHTRQRAALIEVSRTDPLTGCLNRRGFEDRADAVLAAAARDRGEGAVLVLDLDHFKEVNDLHGHAAGDELLRSVVDALVRSIRPGDAIGRIGGDEFAVLLVDIGAADALERAARLLQALSERAPCSAGLASFPSDGTELEQLMRQADVRLYASRSGRAARESVPTAERLSWAVTLARAVDLRMHADHGHSCAVADHAVAIAARLGWAQDELAALRIAATLHDVGKMTIPEAILCKPGRLSDEEFEQIKEHSAAGATLVAGVEGLERIVPWIRHSHESFDGSGYPYGLRGEAIPQASRIMLVADAFDAITSARPYREGLPVAHAREELELHAGSQFDPECVAALLAYLDDTLLVHAPQLTAAA
jgi:diguanylate cyclase (GGDEF)-like protein